MPYTKQNFPDAIEDLPAGAKDIWIATYNSAYDNWDKDKTKQDREGYAFAVAWAAVKKQYHQDKDGKWVKNEALGQDKGVGGTTLKGSNEVNKMQTIKESINTKIEQIKNEVGKRNAKVDEERLKKIQELVSELLADAKAENETKLQEIEKELNEWWGDISGSYEEKKSKIQDTLQKQAKSTYVEALFDDYVICSRYDDLFGQTEYFKVNYTIAPDGTIELTEPVKVEMVTVIKEINEKKGLLWLNEQGGYSEEEREKLEKAREERSKKYKIGIKEGGNLTKPGQYADVSDDEFADPVNYRYPLDTEAHARNAKVRFASADNREAGGYTKEEQQIIWERIVRAELKFGIEVTYNPDEPFDRSLPEEVKKKMKGYEKKTETIQIKPHRLDETLRFKVDILNEVVDKKGEIVEVKAKIDVVQKAGIVNENNRIYPIEVLKPEVNRLSELAKLGGAVMCANHPDNDNNAFSGRDVVAKINEIVISDDGIVSIPSLTFVGTQAGKDYIALAKAGVMLETSQRAMGTSTTKKLNGKPVEFVESLQISGFDLFPFGQVSVKDPDNKVILIETKDKKEMIKMELTQEQLDEIIQKQVNESLKVKEDELKKQSESVQKILDEKRVEDERKKNEQAVKEKIAESDFKFSRFNEKQQQVILEGLDYSGTIENVNKRLDEKIKMMDTAIASAKLEARGYGGIGRGYVSVGNTGVGERIGRLNEELNRQLSNTDKSPVSEAAKDKIKPILEQFDRMYHLELKNEETVAANIFTPTSYARVVIEQILPRITALEVCNIHTMTGLIDTISVNKYSADFDADVSAIEVGEGADLIETGILVTPYTLYATAKKMRTKITYEAMLSAKAAGNINAEAANLAAIAEDVRRRVDRKLWGVMVAMSNCYSTVKVTTAESLVQVGATKAYQAANAGWIEKEYIKKENTTTNLRTAQLVDVGTDATSTLQKVEVIDSSATPKTLVRGYLKADGTVKTSAGADADYYVRYADGQIVIADNPVTAGLTPPYKAKYTYTKNAKVFRVNDTALGNTLADRLTVGRDLTAQVKALVRNRYWTTTFCGMSEEFAEKISAAKEFTSAGLIPAGPDKVSAENFAVTWAGLPITQASAISEAISSAYPVNQMVIGQKGACVYGTFDALSFDGPTATEKAQTYYVAKQSSAEDVPVAAQLATLMLAHYRTE
ncbi:MAG: ChaB family protein [bacterium]